jgi:hypothetical protein
VRRSARRAHDVFGDANGHARFQSQFTVSLLRATGADFREVRISTLSAETFYAETVIRTKDGGEAVIDSRPSGAIANAKVSGRGVWISVERISMASLSNPPDANAQHPPLAGPNAAPCPVSSRRVRWSVPTALL